jgi:hypothetical protein
MFGKCEVDSQALRVEFGCRGGCKFFRGGEQAREEGPFIR